MSNFYCHPGIAGGFPEINKFFIDSDTLGNVPENKAGFWLFNIFARIGFPAERIAFLTANDNLVKDYWEDCEKLYIIPPHQAFKKALEPDPHHRSLGDNKTSLEQWCTNVSVENGQYITFRRAVFDGCDWIRNALGEVPTRSIQFDHFRPVNGESFNIYMAQNYLDSVMSSLPARIAPSERAHVFSRFIWSLSQVWDNGIPTKIISIINGEHGRKLSALGWVMKECRNFISHGSTLGSLDAKLLGFLFIVNSRAMFELPDKPLPYESDILSIVAPDDVQDLTLSRIRHELSASYACLLKAVVSNNIAIEKPPRHSPYFTQLVEGLHKNKCGFPGGDYRIALYQVLWHSLSGFPKGNLTIDHAGAEEVSTRNFEDVSLRDFDPRPDRPYWLRDLTKRIFLDSFPNFRNRDLSCVTTAA